MKSWGACRVCSGSGEITSEEGLLGFCRVSPPGTRIVELTRGHVAIVDVADFERVSAFRWTATNNPGPGPNPKWYAVRSDRGERVYLHRFILEYAGKRVVDHIDGNGLNNSRSNLRVVSHKANMRNRRDSTPTQEEAYERAAAN